MSRWPLVVLLTLFASWGAVHYTIRPVDQRTTVVVQSDASDRAGSATDEERNRLLRAGLMTQSWPGEE